MQAPKKIAVAGTTGRVGRHVVDVLKGGGHAVVAMSRSSGVDVITGEGLAKALAGVECIIDAASWLVGSARRPAAAAPARAVTAPPGGQPGAQAPHGTDAAAGQELGSLEAPGPRVNTAAFSPDGKTLVAGGVSGTLRFWRAATLRVADGRGSRR